MAKKLPAPLCRRLEKAARTAARASYSPYSKFSVGGGERVVRTVVIYTPTPTATSPCGACRQVINEFGPTAVVISICDSSERIETTLDLLLPYAFGPSDLKQKK